jgi:DNA-binding SARP family transcriptional activator
VLGSAQKPSATLFACARTHSYELDLVGAFALRSQGICVALPPSAQRLVAFIALEGRKLSRGFVAGTLWAERSDAQATALLRSALWRANAMVPMITTTGGTLCLAPEVHVVHTNHLEAVKQLLRSEDPLPADLDELVSWLRIDLLTDWYDEWTVGERERVRQVRLHLLDELANKLLRTGRTADAIDVSLTSMIAEPLRPITNEVLIKAHLQEGNRREAVRHFERYRSLMVRELGIEPCPQLLNVAAPTGLNH